MNDVLTLNLRHLGAVAEIGRVGSLSAAAQQVNLSQPALAQALGKVERLLGARLFERQPGGMIPTVAGHILIIRIERALRYLVHGVRLARRSARLVSADHIERRVTMSQLRALIAVESTGSYAMAAGQIGLSQPAVHRAVRDFQQFLGTELFVRAGRSIRSTDIASRFMRFARLMLAELRAGLDEICALTSGNGGRIEIGTLPMARAVFLPDLLTSFMAANPTATVRVIEAPYGELLNALRQGDIDLIIGGALREPPPSNDIVQEILFDDEQVVVGNARHPLRRRKNLSSADLLHFPWIIPSSGVPMRTNWERMFRDSGIEPPEVRIECGSMLIARGLMLKGNWLTLMSRDQIRLECDAGMLAEIDAPGEVLRRRIVLTRRHDWRPTALQAQLVDMAHQCAQHRQSGGPRREGKASR
jgi:LysR family transcriptional regulator of gallate degradation